MQNTSPFPDSSHCRQALLNELDDSLVVRTLPTKSRLDFLDSQHTPDSTPPAVLLSVVNSGSGTTGTHSVYDSMCALKYKGVHFRLSCNNPDDPQSQSAESKSKRQALEQWHVMLTQCVLSSSQQQHCLSPTVLNKLRRALRDAFSVIEFFTDSPTDVIFPEIIALAPATIKVIGTYRNPSVWAKRRLRTHGTTQLICRPELWSQPTILHPFDLLGCLLYIPHSNSESSFYPSDALMTTFEYINGVSFDIFKQSSETERADFARLKGHKLDSLAKAYQLMNTVNMHLLQAREMEFLPVCLWDLPKRNNSVLHYMIGEFLRKEKDPSLSRGRRRRLAAPGDREQALEYMHTDMDDALMAAIKFQEPCEKKLSVSGPLHLYSSRQERKEVVDVFLNTGFVFVFFSGFILLVLLLRLSKRRK